MSVAPAMMWSLAWATAGGAGQSARDSVSAALPTAPTASVTVAVTLTVYTEQGFAAMIVTGPLAMPEAMVVPRTATM